jgi:hypothetical protein
MGGALPSIACPALTRKKRNSLSCGEKFYGVQPLGDSMEFTTCEVAFYRETFAPVLPPAGAWNARYRHES